MVVRKNKKTETKVEEIVKPVKPEATPSRDKWMTVSWMILLVGGLAHMMPTQMAPILNFAVYGVTVQTAVGVLSVIAALYYLLEE